MANENRIDIPALVDMARKSPFYADRLCVYRASVSEEDVIRGIYQYGDDSPVLYDSDKIVIYGGATDIVAEIKDFEYIEQMMGERYIQFDLATPVCINWNLGDWVLFRGEKFTLNAKPGLKKQSRPGAYGASFVYNGVKFDSIVGDLITKQFLDYVPGDNNAHYSGLDSFSFYVSSLWDFAYRLQANLDRVYPGKWIVECKEGGEKFKDKSVSISANTSIFNALTLVNSQLYQNFDVRVREVGYEVQLEVKTEVLTERMNVITIGGPIPIMPEAVSYGKGNGLVSLQKVPKNSTPEITRLHAYGSKRNMPTRYYNRKYKLRTATGEPAYPQFWKDGKYLLDTKYIPNLMLPVDYWTKGESNIFDVFIDSTTENFQKAGIDEQGKLEYVDGVLQNPQDVVEGSKTFDTEDKDYDECYPTLRGMTIDHTWENKVYAYLTGYRNYPIALDELVKSIIKSHTTFSFVEKIEIPGVKEMSIEEWESEYPGFSLNVVDGTEGTIDRSTSKEKEKILYNIWVDEHWLLKSPNEERPIWSITEKPEPDTLYSGTREEWFRPGSLPVTFKYKIEVSCLYHNTSSRRAMNAAFQSGYLTKDDPPIAEETLHRKALLDYADVSYIISETFNKEGRLDKVLSESFTKNWYGGRHPINDNGVSEDGGGFGTKDTNGVEIVDGFTLDIPQICFDINDWQYDQEAKIAMVTGMCAGREFVIADCVLRNQSNYHGGWELTLGRTIDGDTQRIYPNKDFMIQPGDEYVLIGVNLPHVYVEAAERKLFKNAMKYLQNADTKIATYTPQIDSKWIKENPEYDACLRTGIKFRFNDDDVEGDGERLITIKQLSIKYGKAPLPSYEITLDEETESVSLAQLVASSIKNSATDGTGLIGDASDKLSKTGADTAKGRITFDAGISVNESLMINGKSGYTGTRTIPMGEYNIIFTFDNGVLIETSTVIVNPKS